MVAPAIDLTSNYVLSRDRPKEEWRRLNLQHRYLIKFVEESRLIYDSSVSLPNDASILDLGCGTGIWLADIAKEAPNDSQWTFHGVDVSRTQFSMSTSLPANINFTQASVVSLPEHWVNSFNFAQLRMMHVALSDTEWPLALSETYRVLRLNGLIQLLVPMKPCGNTPAILRQADLFNKLLYAAGMDPDLPQKLPHLVRHAGFRDVHCDIRMVALNEKLMAVTEKDEPMPSLATLLLAAVKRTKAKAVELKCVYSEEEFDNLILELEKDWNVRDRPMYGYFLLVTARK